MPSNSIFRTDANGVSVSLTNLAQTLGIEDFEGWKALNTTNKALNEVISQLDVKLNQVLKKQEYEYLQAYNIYVKRKEKELRELIAALDEKNSNNNIKDMRISQLEVSLEQMRKDAFGYEQNTAKLMKTIKEQSEKFKLETEEKDFYHKQALDAKRKNKLLKLAIGRIQVQRENERQSVP